MTSFFVEARAITKSLPPPAPGVPSPVLVHNVSLGVEPGEFVAITGPSGSGKSSLLYLLGLLDRPTEGTVILDGQDTAGMSADELASLRLSRLGFVFQFHFLLPEFSAMDNVMIPMRKLGKLQRREMIERVENLFADLELTDQLRKLPGQMSGGQRQRVAIARALANDPLLVLADEPTGNLDSKSAHNVFATLRALADRHNHSILAVTHDLELARMAHRHIHLVDGEIVTTTFMTSAP